jgi:small GTP-binding protein
MEPKVIKLKICLVGEEAVGKTSLIRRFSTGQFDESYIRTLGAVVTKRSLKLKEPSGGDMQVDMVILDIMGKRTFMQLFKDAYFSGARGILAVFDMTRKASLKELLPWINGVRETVGPVPVVALANKVDLTERQEIRDNDIEQVLGSLKIKTVKTSAKTGENVEQVFIGLARELTLDRA